MELEQHPDAQFVILKNSTHCLFRRSSSSTTTTTNRLAFLSKVPDSWGPKTFLGLNTASGGSPIFAVDVPADAPNVSSSLLSSLPDNAFFDNTRTHAPLLPSPEYELILYATALSNWKRTHKFCSLDGHPLIPVQGGTVLQCTNPSCQVLSWPRHDPSIIVLVTNRSGDKALLARSPRHPPKLYTTLAGFVEAGESLERAVVREVFEETGVHVDPTSIQYWSSQPWPFPRSYMIGFHATAAVVVVENNNNEHSDDSLPPLSIDEQELVSAAWFDKSKVAAAAQVSRGAIMNDHVAQQALDQDPSLSLLIPPKGVLARSLIDAWLYKLSPWPMTVLVMVEANASFCRGSIPNCLFRERVGEYISKLFLHIHMLNSKQLVNHIGPKVMQMYRKMFRTSVSFVVSRDLKTTVNCLQKLCNLRTTPEQGTLGLSIPVRDM